MTLQGGAAGFQNTMSALLEDVSGHRAFELGSRDELGRCLASTSSEHHLRRQNRWNSREALENYNNNPTQPEAGPTRMATRTEGSCDTTFVTTVLGVDRDAVS